MTLGVITLGKEIIKMKQLMDVDSKSKGLELGYISTLYKYLSKITNCLNSKRGDSQKIKQIYKYTYKMNYGHKAKKKYKKILKVHNKRNKILHNRI